MSEADYMRVFNEIDVNGDGALDLEELKTAMTARGYPANQLVNYFNSSDISGDGKITKDEYLVAMGLQPPAVHKGAAMRRLFRDFDTDGSGAISRDELQNVFAEMGKSFSDDEIQRMIGLADQDGSASLNYEEFIRHCFGDDAV